LSTAIPAKRRYPETISGIYTGEANYFIYYNGLGVIAKLATSD
jgi:hypothetical protein